MNIIDVYKIRKIKIINSNKIKNPKYFNQILE